VSAACSIDENHIVEHLSLCSIGGVHNGVACNGRRIFAIALFEQVDSPDLLTTAELAEIADVYPELLDSTRTESVCRYYQHTELVLEKEVGDFAEVGGFADTVDTNNTDDVGACIRRLDSACDVTEEVER
jgi:hypothetical protein